MITFQITINLIIFTLGLFGICFNYTNMLISLIGIELMLLSLNFNMVLLSSYFNDIFGQIFSILLLTVAAAESAIGLAILIVVFRVRGTLEVQKVSTVRG